MKYRVRMNVFFTKKTDADGIFNQIKAIQAKLENGNSVENWSYDIHKCYHDENPSKPCEMIEKHSG